LYRKLKVPVTEIKKSEFNLEIDMLMSDDELGNYLHNWKRAKSMATDSISSFDNQTHVTQQLLIGDGIRQ